jgi:hypothetical protein
MVYIKVADPGFDPAAFDRHCHDRGVWVRSNKQRFRLVLHHQVTSGDVDRAVDVISGFFEARH